MANFDWNTFDFDQKKAWYQMTTSKAAPKAATEIMLDMWYATQQTASAPSTTTHVIAGPANDYFSPVKDMNKSLSQMEIETRAYQDQLLEQYEPELTAGSRVRLVLRVTDDYCRQAASAIEQASHKPSSLGLPW